MKEFTGGGLTVYELTQAVQRGEVISLVLGRSGVLRLYILPLSWADHLEDPCADRGIDDLPRVSVDDLSKEAVAGKIIMEQGAAVVTISRNVPQALIVPANRRWRDLVEPEESDGS